MRLLIFGFGYSARAAFLRVQPRIETAWGTTRDPGRVAGIAALGVGPILFDASPGAAVSGAPLADALDQATHILVAIAPDERGDPVLRHFREVLAARPRPTIYLSTVGVYGDHAGAWVDETSECRPVSVRSRQRVATESEWIQLAEVSGAPVAILRLAGIYGPGRGPFEKLCDGTAQRIVKPGQVFNRIHVDDIAAAIAAAFARRAVGTFNISDDEPAPPQDVLAYAAELLGVPVPPEVPFQTARLSPMAQSFYGESKRVGNAKMKLGLGMRLEFATFREGLRAILATRAISSRI